MSTPGRPTLRSGRARRSSRGAHGTPAAQPRSPVALSQVVNEGRQALQALGDQLATMASGLQLNGSPRAPAPPLPERCALEMSSASFRTWKRSMLQWLKLHRLQPTDSVQHIRLHCTPELQRVLDARYTEVQWAALSPERALDAIGAMVLRASNQAVHWAEFFVYNQGRDESISEYFAKCAQKAIDCGFQCPICDSDLSEYMLMRKLMVGLRDEKLKSDLFRSCESFVSVDALRAVCATYEAARKDASMPQHDTWHQEPRAADVETDPAPLECAVVKGNNYRSCANCGGQHEPKRASCPARNSVCHGCQKIGHLKRCCRGMSKKKVTNEASGVLMGGVTLGSVTLGAVTAGVIPSGQPLIDVNVSVLVGGAKPPCVVPAVADTGAQVCVAGPSLLAMLGKGATLARPHRGLRDVADLQLGCMGTLSLNIQLRERSTVQEVYFIKTAKCLFLSLDACKGLGLVPDSFPHHDLTSASLAVEEARPPPPKPASVPFPPLEENVSKLEQWLLRHFSASTFNTSREPLPIMEGLPHHIHLVPGATPYACHTPIMVAKHWELEVKKQLDEDVRKGIIEAVPTGEASEWCTRMVIVAKKSGQPRRTVDFQRLNAYCRRETHHTPPPFDMISGVPLHSFKTVADAHWGFHQVELDEESRKLTTFITPWGRYRYRRTPMGHCSASDAYTKRFDDAIKDIPRKYKCIDDTLLYDTSIEEAFWHAYDLLETCARKGITLKPEKFCFCRREVNFVGFQLGWDAYSPTEESLAAIRNFSMPDSPTITDIRSWFGFVNQLAPFLATAPLMEPFRDLLKKSSSKKVYWDSSLQEKFKQAQEAICKLAKDGLVYYDKARPTVALTDWSKEGIGFVILQQYCNCTSADSPFCCKGGWRIALCGSRHLSRAEAGYAPIEGEALAVTWCLKKARLFLLGCPNLLLITDHRPLVKLMGDKELKDIDNPRLFRLKEKTLPYKFQIKYLPGKRNCAADFLSRFPALRCKPDDQDSELEDDMTAALVAASASALERECCVMDEETVKEAAASDPVYQLLMAKVAAGDWNPQKAQEVACLRQFYSVRDRLSLVEDLILYTYDQGYPRLLIPEGLRPQVIVGLHSGHQGVDSMLRRARQSVYWPGMEGDLQSFRDGCAQCDLHAPSQPAEPLVLTPPPAYPFQSTVMDMMQIQGYMYMAYADRLTGWLEVAHFPHGTTSSRIISVLRTYFTRWGAPEIISTDGGTNLVSEEVRSFFERWGVKTRISSAHYPQSNGRAEVAVKTAKRIIRSNLGKGGSLDCDKASLAILQYLNTPLKGFDKSPAQLATGRTLRDGVPTPKQHYKVEKHWEEELQRREQYMASQEGSPSPGARELRPLTVGCKVRVQDPITKVWDRSGLVVEFRGHRQYLIRLDGSGRVSLRNRKHLKVCSTPPTVSETPIQREVSQPRPKRHVKQPARFNEFVMSKNKK